MIGLVPAGNLCYFYEMLCLSRALQPPPSTIRSSRVVPGYQVSLRAFWLGLIGASILALPGIAIAQDRAESALQDSGDGPAFDLIFLDEPPVTTLASLSLPSGMEAQRPDTVSVVLRAQSTFAPIAPPPDNIRAHDLGVPKLRELPPADPLARLASLIPPKSADMFVLDPRARIVGTEITPLLDEEQIEDDLTEMSPEDLAVELQTELARVGCYRLRVDGQWGPGSRRALANYLTRSDQSTDGQEPTPEVIRMVRASEPEVCPAPVARAPAAAAPAARQAAPQPASPPRQAAPAPAPAPSAPSSGGGSRLGSGIMSGLRCAQHHLCPARSQPQVIARRAEDRRRESPAKPDVAHRMAGFHPVRLDYATFLG